MAVARVVAFEDVDSARIEELKREMQEGGPPDDVPVTEILMLHDPESSKALAVLFFDSDADYERGNRALDAMPAGDTPGRRTSVGRYQVAARMSR
jgi:hypothetical protein